MGTTRVKRAALGAASGVVGAAVATFAAGSMLPIVVVLLFDEKWAASNAASTPYAGIGILLAFGMYTLPIGVLTGAVARLVVGSRLTTAVGRKWSVVIGASTALMFVVMFTPTLRVIEFAYLGLVAVLSGALGGYVAWRVGRWMAIGRAERDGGDEDGRVGGRTAEVDGGGAERSR